MNRAVRVFDEYADNYDHWFDTHKEIYENQLTLLSSHLPGRGTGLEIGVGSGRFAAPLEIRYGLDPSLALLSMAQHRGVEPVQGMGESLPYRTGIFDYILMMTVICFMDDITQAFRETYRVLRPGGMLVTGFMEKDGEIARQEHMRKSPGMFLKYAVFPSTEKVMASLASEGFTAIIFRENLQGFCVVTAQKE